jgi:acyl-CoA hydrolase
MRNPLRYHASMHRLLRSTRVTGVVAMLLALVSACSDRPPHVALPASAKVLALGDSLTYGTGAGDAASYPAVLATTTGWDVVNAGVPGETAAQGCARLPALLDEHHPQLVLVLLGGNDFLRRLPVAGVRDALANCVASARDAGTRVVLLPVPRLGVGGLANATVYAEASRELGVPLVDNGLADLLGSAAMRADAVHPNAAGYRAMASRIADGLREQGFLAH